ncbi:MAG: RNA polymerase sigma factor [Kofleriaceae bacterium]
MTTPSPPQPDAFELELFQLVERGEIDQATEQAIRRYGPELIGWLCAILPEHGDAHEAFSRMSEDLWRSLPKFERRCSLRTWCYMLARHAAGRVRNEPNRRRELLVSSIPSVAHAVTHVWNTTRINEQREHDVYAELRRSLDEEAQTLLVLRVDRDLSWRDIAVVMLGDTAGPDELTRKAAALRKQFERVKDQLRAMAGKKLER